MILEHLTLNNFGIFQGEHSFTLCPSGGNGKPSPIVLFGGTNGSGKTTILDAIHLALYGPRANAPKRSGQAYESYLRDSIHRSASPSDGASVSLSFRYVSEGEPHCYDVFRSWQDRQGKVREALSVSRDGLKDRWLSDNWNQVVEDLIPLGISQLFFFDAEKIRFLAEDPTTSDSLRPSSKS